MHHATIRPNKYNTKYTDVETLNNKQRKGVKYKVQFRHAKSLLPRNKDNILGHNDDKTIEH